MFDYYGSKNQLAKMYPEPEYGLIIEPFAGSAAYSMHWLQKRQELKCVLVEKSDRVVGMWNWLKTASEPDIDKLFSECVLGQKTTNPFIMSMQTSNAFFNCRYMTINQRMVNRVSSMVKRMKTFLPVMERVTVIHGDYARIPNVEATWFIDPPYQPVGDSIRGNGYDKKSKCTPEFIDFNALGEWCKSRTGQVIVCEQEGANWLPFRVLREAKNSQNRKYREMIWTNN